MQQGACGEEIRWSSISGVPTGRSKIISALHNVLQCAYFSAVIPACAVGAVRLALPQAAIRAFPLRFLVMPGQYLGLTVTVRFLLRVFSHELLLLYFLRCPKYQQQYAVDDTGAYPVYDDGAGDDEHFGGGAEDHALCLCQDRDEGNFCPILLGFWLLKFLKKSAFFAKLL